MIGLAMALVAAAAAALIAGIVRGDDLGLVYLSIGLCLAAGACLGVGVLRARPRDPDHADRAGVAPTWSGASPLEPDGPRAGDDPAGREP